MFTERQPALCRLGHPCASAPTLDESQLCESSRVVLGRRRAARADPNRFARRTESSDRLGLVVTYARPQVLPFPGIGRPAEAIQLPNCGCRSFRARELRRWIDVLPALEEVRESLDTYSFDLPPCDGELPPPCLFQQPPRHPTGRSTAVP